MGARNELKSRIFQAQVKKLKDEGWSISRIAKELGKSYKHTKNIYERG